MFLCPWDSPGKNIGEGCHALLQGILLTQGLNLRILCLLHWKTGSSPLAPLLAAIIVPGDELQLINPVNFRNREIDTVGLEKQEW